MSSRK